MSMRAASHPSPKNRGSASSHQNSISMRSVHLAFAFQTGHLAAQATDLALLAEQRGEGGGHAEHRARGEGRENHEHQRQAPFAAEEEVQVDELVVLDGEAEQEEEQQEPD